LLSSQGDENAIGATLTFDPAVLSFSGASLGAAAPGALLNLNSGQATAGRLSFVLALPTGATFVAGTQEILDVRFRAAGGVVITTPISFADQPVIREIVDANASLLTANYVNGLVQVSTPPLLSIAQSQNASILSWPIWAVDYLLEGTIEAGLSSNDWQHVESTVVITNGARSVTVPLDPATMFYRLRRP